jgi:DNA-binding response OmpR family regulator
MKVLVVDDDGSTRLILRRLLSHFPVEVRLAGNGVEALAAIEADPPDLVLLDVMMPEMDGVATLAAIRSSSRSAGLPVVSISAVSDREMVLRMVNLGLADYLLKPLNIESAHKRLDRILASLPAERRRAAAAATSPAGTRQCLERLGAVIRDSLSDEALAAARQVIGMLGGQETVPMDADELASVPREVVAAATLRLAQGDGAVSISIGGSGGDVESFGARIAGQSAGADTRAAAAFGELVDTVAGRLRSLLDGRGFQLEQPAPAVLLGSSSATSTPGCRLGIKVSGGERFVLELGVSAGESPAA